MRSNPINPIKCFLGVYFLIIFLNPYNNDVVGV